MKNINLLLLSLFILSFSLHAQEISFTFTANHTCIYAELDSVVVENLTQGGDTVLYYPDTVLTLFFTGIETAPFAGNAFSVSQNYPNPYSSKTQIDVFAPEEDEFTIKVFDITGRQVNTYKNILGRGMHNFVFNGGNSTNYVLTVNSTKFLQKILMIHTGTGEKQNASLLYKGIIPGEKSIKTSEKSNFVYNIGDNLEFTGYVNDDFETIVDAPTTNNDYVFDINNTNPSVPTAGIHVAGEDQIEWNWNTVEDATGYKYNTVDDYFTAADNGTSISYTQADLNCEIAYTLYVWAYNDCGVSTSVELSEITTDCPTITICGEETKIVDVTNSTTGDTWMDR
ncbi:MAG: T9SS type A sorting domain-containing protein, partial [Bacteroidota bacterium]|nr:T9SS type A sorting domain-containing protein [Bacteroidota bacterium]